MNWDDTDSENDNVVVEEKPVILPRARQPSLAKSLEKVQILESSVAGSEKNDEEDDSDALSDVTDYFDDENENENDQALKVTFDSFTNKSKIISLFNCSYTNIIREFADVEIFVISLDSLIVECAAHTYHNWEFAGQSLVLTTQINRFLNKLVDVGGRFKIAVFTDLTAQFSRDTTLSFARSVVIADLMSGKYASDVMFFTSPVDTKWKTFIDDLTPSFIMISTDNVTSDVCASEDVNLTPHFETIVIDCLSRAVPVVLLRSIVFNFVSVDAFLIYPRLIEAPDLECFLAANWECNTELFRNHFKKNVKMNEFNTPGEFWAKVIQEAKKSGDCSESFDKLSAAIILSSMICNRRGAQRIYYPEKVNAKRGLNVIRDRRIILKTASAFLEAADFEGMKINVNDLWDGRMVSGIFDELNANESVLPYRLQEEFAKLHDIASLKIPLAVDTNEKLFDPLPEKVNPLMDLPIMYSVTSPLLKKFVPELTSSNSKNMVVEGEVADYAEVLKTNRQWRFEMIQEEYAAPDEVIDDKWKLRKANKQKQQIYKWYEMFSNALEGRGSNLLVDFSRVPKGFATVESDGENEDKKKKHGGPAGKGGKKGAGKDAGKTKKEMILAANKKAKDQKICEGEKAKIRFGIQQGKDAITFLENLYTSLELAETRAICRFEVTIREAKKLLDSYQGNDKLEARRVAAVILVGHLKECFSKHWELFEQKQKDQIVDIWVSLGFEAPPGCKPSFEARQKKLNLDINMVYYQLMYGGELIDIQSDPKKDDRVSGFSPDYWQRTMLDSVDRGNSALIVAPTSAGKTFVSYYCIEKVLRSSDTDVVVYVSPSKALINQACGSVYARFRNKAMRTGMSLFGTLTKEYSQNALNCQVLITIPDCFQEMLLSRTPKVQKFVKNIKYVVFDEVHCIGASDESHIWEQLLLLIPCPFLALSATVGNQSTLHNWLNSSEMAKSNGKRKVDLISYGERYSELELSILNINDPTKNEDNEANDEAKETSVNRNAVLPLMPYGVYNPEKLRMFSIPEDQQLTARQILTLFQMMSQVDSKIMAPFEPCKFFGQHGSKAVWLSRKDLRSLEKALKEKFLEWLNTDEKKINEILEIISSPVQKQLDYRLKPFNKEKVASSYIIPLVDEMKQTEQLPAICFSDDRLVCESLALKVCIELENRENDYVESDEFKDKYEIKNEEKLMKLMKKKEDIEAKKKKKKTKKSEKFDKEEKELDMRENDDERDVLAMKKARIAQALERFKLRGRGGGDSDLYEKMTSRMLAIGKNRESTKKLLRLFERGIGFHHDALNAVEKGAVEVLFRSGNLALLFSTSTLSLGVNMPCKTVMFGVDTFHLTPLLYRQMSGRAGRRGFDHSGNVIFMSIPTRKIRRLLTASLSNLKGNPPFTTSFLLRLFSFVHQRDPTLPENLQILDIKRKASAAKSLLEHSFSLFTRKEAKSGVLQKQLRMFSAFSFVVLRHLQLLTPMGAAKNFADLAMFVHAGDAGTLTFIYLMQRGCFHQLLKKYEGDEEQCKRVILEILVNLFTNVRMSAWFKTSEERCNQTNYLIYLRGLPEYLQPYLNEYNSVVKQLYTSFMIASTEDGNLFDANYDTSGKMDVDKFSFTNEDLASPIFEDYSNDKSFLPIVETNNFDHRGRKLYRNAFAFDLFYHCSLKLLIQMNEIPVQQAWHLIYDFMKKLERLSVGLESVSRPQDPLSAIIKTIYKEYDEKFKTVFKMRGKE